jgi:hypothetical protein
MADTSQDRRERRRFSVDIQAVVTLSSGDRVAVRTRDLSRTGICLVAASPFELGDKITIDLSLSFGDNTFSEPLTLGARVMWCTAMAEVFQVGIMFDGPTPEQSKFVEMFSRYLEGAHAPDGVSPIPASEDESSQEDDAPLSPDVTDNPFR